MSVKRPLLQAVIYSTCLFALCRVFVAEALGETKSLPRADFFGCTALRDTVDGTVCMLTPDDQLVLWVGPRDCRDLEVSEANKRVGFETKEVQNGCQLRIAGRTEQNKATLTVTDLRSGKALWLMRLDRTKPSLMKWKKRIWNRVTSDLEEVLPELQRMLTQNLDTETDIDVSMSLAVIRMREGKRDEAIRQYGQVARRALATGYRSIADDAMNYRSDLLLKSGMSEEMRAVIGRNMASSASTGDARRLILSYWQAGRIALTEERFEEAAERMGTAVSAAERVHDLDMQRVITPPLMELLVKLGRMPEVERLMSTIEPLLEATTECRRASFLNGVAFSGLVLAEGHDPIEPGRAIKIARYTLRDLFKRALNSRLQCRQDSALENLYQGLGWLSLFESQYDEARGWLAKARSLSDRDTQDEMEELDLESQLAIAGRSVGDAKHLLNTLEDLSARNPTIRRREFQCRVAVGTLETLRISGQEDVKNKELVRSCISLQGSHLAPAESKWITRRAKAVGFVVP